MRLLAVLIAAAVAAGQALSQDPPVHEIRAKVGQPVNIPMPTTAADTNAGVIVYRSRLIAAPPGAAPAIENGEQRVTVTGTVPGQYRLELSVVSVQQTTCSASEEKVLGTQEAVLSLAR
jgi:hypothetical protein